MTDDVTRDARRRKAPAGRLRMLHLEPPVVAAGRPRAVLHADVPERLIRMTEFGLRHARADESGWWRRVEREMQTWVDALLPPRARDVRMHLDGEAMQVVVDYELAAP